MKQKQKTKKSAAKRSYKPKAEKYPTHYLAIVLSLVLLIEGIAIGSTTSADWQKASSVLDVSGSFSLVVSDLNSIAQPSIAMVHNIDEFYRQASVEMAVILDMSGKIDGVTVVYDGIDEFYAQASIEMASLLDLSDSIPQLGQVSGIWIEN